jgi:hypothetical protein
MTAPLCYDCHTRYDAGKATATDLRKLGITRWQYSHHRPKHGKSKSRSIRKHSTTDIDKSWQEMSKAVRKAAKKGY